MLSSDFLLVWKFCSFYFDVVSLPPRFRGRELEAEGNETSPSPPFLLSLKGRGGSTDVHFLTFDLPK